MKKINELSQNQQKALYTIFLLRQESFLSSEVARKLLSLGWVKGEGKSVGGVLSALYRNGFLEKIQGGRDKRWKFSEEVNRNLSGIKKLLDLIKTYWI
jgi:hypothetical protein